MLSRGPGLRVTGGYASSCERPRQYRLEMSESRATDLRTLYSAIHSCDRCFGDPGCLMQPDPAMVDREVLPEALDSEVFLVGQALGPNTQRKSGRPYLTPDGTLGPSGRNLDRFLRYFGYTIRPGSSARYAYSTDLVQRYPGPGRSGDRKPTPQEIANCAPWFIEELRLVAPRVVILMGLLATKGFFRQFLGVRVRRISEVLERRYDVTLADREVAVFSILHPSPLATHPDKQGIYQRTAGAIREALNREPR